MGIDPIRLDAAIGHQRSSMRPSSARYSFTRSARRREESKQEETPGPTDYDYEYASTILHGASTSVVMGKADRAQDSYLKPYPYPHVGGDREAEEIADNNTSRFGTPGRAVFGKEERDAKAMDFETMRSCPQQRYGEGSPGFVYQPDDRCTRPRSAPSFTMRQRQAGASRASTPAKVAPNSYAGAREASIGVQRDSRRRTARASSFSRSERFPAPKSAEGNLAEESKTVDSCFGNQRSGTGRRAAGYNAIFGSAKRECSANGYMGREADGPTSVRSNRPRMPHPPLAPQQELIRYSSNMDKQI